MVVPDRVGVALDLDGEFIRRPSQVPDHPVNIIKCFGIQPKVIEFKVNDKPDDGAAVERIHFEVIVLEVIHVEIVKTTPPLLAMAAGAIGRIVVIAIAPLPSRTIAIVIQ